MTKIIDAAESTAELAVFEGRALRVTDDKKRMSVFDIIAATGDKNPRTTWENLKQQHPEVVEFAYNIKFTGRGQKETPTVDKRGLYHLLFLLPGKRVVPFRVWAATTLDRVIEGDISLAEEIVSRAAHNIPAAPAPQSGIAELTASVAQLVGVVSQLVAFQRAPLPASQAGQLPPIQSRLPLRPPVDDRSPWYWPSEIGRKLNISVREVWDTARELKIDGSVYQREQRRKDNTIGAQFHQWAANEIARRVNQLRRPNG